MSTTREGLRARLRAWLEDPAPGGLWTDDDLNEALQVALDGYSLLAPAELTATLTAAAGDTTLALPDGCVTVTRVTDRDGYVIPPRTAPARSGPGEELAWERWGDALTFSRPLPAGDYAVRYLGGRTLPGDGVAIPIPDGDGSLLVAGAVVWAIEGRMREEWKRGPLPSRYEERRDAARQDYRDLRDAFRRRLRARTLGTTG